MKGKIKAISLFVVLALVFQMMVPMLRSIAATPADMNGYNTLEFKSGATTIDNADGAASVKVVMDDDTNLTLEGTALYSDVSSKMVYTQESSIKVTAHCEEDYQIRGDFAGTSYTLTDGQSQTIALGGNYTQVDITKEAIPSDPDQGQQGGNNNQGGSGSSEIPVQFDSDTIAGNVVTFTVDEEEVTATVTGATISNGEVRVDRNNLGGVTFTISDNFDSENMQVIVRGANQYSQELVLNEGVASLDGLNIPNGGLHFSIEHKSGGDDPDPQVPTNKTATINLTHVINENYQIGADVAINGYMLDPGSTTLEYYLADGATTVTFTFSTLWHLRYYDTISINGTDYEVSDYLNYDDQKSWLDHYDGQMVGFDIPNIDVEDTYNIEVKVGRQVDSYIGNFLWTGDPNQSDGEDYIGHAHLEMVGLEYTLGDTTYTYTEEDFKSGSFDRDYVEYTSDQSLNYDEGSLVVPAGSIATMRITPEYGYQVVAANMAKSGLTTTDSGVCEFTFTVPAGAAYFTADVIAVEDEVKAESSKVSSGDIVLADGSLTTGTAVLSVSDVDLDSSKMTDFEEAAEGYEIKSYLDIDLDQVFYRGTSDSVWANRIHEVNDYATITLKLEDGVDGNDIVIVHNINDGDKFEVIEIESYDPETNTITFKTKSFSNYAIASRHVHELTLVPAQDPTYEAEGNIAYYVCEECGKWFEDAQGTVEIENEDDVIIPKLVQPSYDVVIQSGTAKVKGSVITSAKEGDMVTITASNVEGKEFVRWEVSIGEVTLADATKATTTFTMPDSEVLIIATYQDETTEEVVVPIVNPKVTPSDVIVGMTDNIKEVAEEIISDTIANNPELAAAVEGKNIVTAIDIDPVTTVTAAEKNAIDEKLATKAEDATIVGYYEIDITIYDADTNQELGQITELTNAITFTVLLPEELQTVAEGYTRTFYMVRMHNGIPEFINAKLSDDGKSVTFASDKFSTYALAYVDTVTPTSTTNETNASTATDTTTTDTTTGSAQTGDNVSIWMVLLTVSTIGLLLTRKSMKRRA